MEDPTFCGPGIAWNPKKRTSRGNMATLILTKNLTLLQYYMANTIISEDHIIGR